MYDPNGNQSGNGYGRFSQTQGRFSSPMGVASVACAIIGLFTIMTGFFAVIFGSLAMLFAFLSKGSQDKVQRPAVYGKYIGLAAALVGAVLIIYSFAAVNMQYGSIQAFYDEYMYTIEEEYGIDLGY